MSARLIRLMGVVMLAAALFVPTGASAAFPGGPAEATAPPADWVEIQPGQYHWYKFNFDYDSKADMQDVLVKFYTSPGAGALLTIRNGNQAALWERDGTQESFGAATVQSWLKHHDDEKEMRANEGKKEKDHVHTAVDAKQSDAFATWRGRLNASGTYYLVVEHARNLKDPVSYKIEISGNGVSFPGAAPIAAAPAPAPVAAAAAPVIEQAAVRVPLDAARGPDFAMAPNGEWMTINNGEYIWFAFRYAGAKENTKPINVKLFTSPAGAAMLTVRSAAQADLWRRDGQQLSIGQCTCANNPVTHDDEKEMRANEGKKEKDHVHTADNATTSAGYGEWVGAPAERGVYYLVVEHARNVTGPVQFRVELQGDGVTPGL